MTGPNRQPVLLVGGTVRTARTAREHGVDVVLLQRPEEFDPQVGEFIVDHRLVNFADAGALLECAHELHRSRPFRRALSLTESGLVPAAQVNDALGLGGNPLATVRLLKNKWLMRQRLVQVGLSPVRARLASSELELRRVVAELGYPVIVKPLEGSGSAHVARLDGPTGVPAAWDAAAGASGHALVEEYLDGPEVSVETFSVEGVHRVIAITEKITLPNYVELGHVVPSSLGAEVAVDVTELVTSFLGAVGLRDGPAHTEVKLTHGGPRIIESHDRVGGDSIADLVLLSTGTNLVGLAFLLACGALTEAPPVPRGIGAAAIQFLTAAPGTVVAVDGAERVRRHPAVRRMLVQAQPGEQVWPVRSSRDRLGFVLVEAAHPDEARSLAAKLTAQVRITTAAEPSGESHSSGRR